MILSEHTGFGPPRDWKLWLRLRWMLLTGKARKVYRCRCGRYQFEGQVDIDDHHLAYRCFHCGERVDQMKPRIHVRVKALSMRYRLHDPNTGGVSIVVGMPVKWRGKARCYEWDGKL